MWWLALRHWCALSKVPLARAAMTLNLARDGGRIIAKKKTFKGNPVCLGRVATL